MLEATWTAVGAVIISGMAFGRTILAEQRAIAKDMKTGRSTRFETDFGHPIRDELRSFEKTLNPLRVLTLPVATPPKDRLGDLADRRPEWDKASADVEMLLREADSSSGVTCSYWADTWQDNVARADIELQALTDFGEPSDSDVRAKAEQALYWYSKAIGDARSGLETERGMLQPLPPAGILGWIREIFFGVRS